MCREVINLVCPGCLEGGKSEMYLEDFEVRAAHICYCSLDQREVWRSRKVAGYIDFRGEGRIK